MEGEIEKRRKGKKSGTERRSGGVKDNLKNSDRRKKKIQRLIRVCFASFVIKKEELKDSIIP